MKTVRSSTLAIIGAIVAVTGAAGEEYPFSAIENVPERGLFGVDENDYPRIAVKDMAQVAGLAASNETPENLRFYSIWGLAISGYSPESATGLAKALEDQELSDTARGYAAMGLRNFTAKLPKESKEDLRSMLKILEILGARPPVRKSA